MNLVKVSEASGPALDWAVAKCEGYEDDCISDEWNYSTNWSQAGPIIEREKIVLIPPHDDIEAWEAYHPTRIHDEEYGPTPLIAAMRCYVAAHLGDEIDVPGELA